MLKLSTPRPVKSAAAKIAQHSSLIRMRTTLVRQNALAAQRRYREHPVMKTVFFFQLNF